jgi:hypothetical protein
LLKQFRPCGPYDEDAEIAAWEANKHEDPLAWLIDKYGEDKGKRFYYIEMAHACIMASWECRDCIGLGTNEYWQKRYEGRLQKTTDSPHKLEPLSMWERLRSTCHENDI